MKTTSVQLQLTCRDTFVYNETIRSMISRIETIQSRIVNERVAKGNHSRLSIYLCTFVDLANIDETKRENRASNNHSTGTRRMHVSRLVIDARAQLNALACFHPQSCCSMILSRFSNTNTRPLVGGRSPSVMTT
jgi:hypothetical protein